jgi:hypothetical protein
MAYGARPLRRWMESHIITDLSRQVGHLPPPHAAGPWAPSVHIWAHMCTICVCRWWWASCRTPLMCTVTWAHARQPARQPARGTAAGTTCRQRVRKERKPGARCAVCTSCMRSRCACCVLAALRKVGAASTSGLVYRVVPKPGQEGGAGGGNGAGADAATMQVRSAGAAMPAVSKA